MKSNEINSTIRGGTRDDMRDDMERAVGIACAVTGVPCRVAMTRSRHAIHTITRGIVCRILMRQGYTLQAIGKFINRHYSTVIHALRRADHEIDSEGKYADYVLEADHIDLGVEDEYKPLRPKTYYPVDKGKQAPLSPDRILDATLRHFMVSRQRLMNTKVTTRGAAMTARYTAAYLCRKHCESINTRGARGPLEYKEICVIVGFRVITSVTRAIRIVEGWKRDGDQKYDHARRIIRLAKSGKRLRPSKDRPTAVPTRSWVECERCEGMGCTPHPRHNDEPEINVPKRCIACYGRCGRHIMIHTEVAA